jgi:hypothetical protein
VGNYCDEDDVRRAAGLGEEFTTEQSQAAGNWIERASSLVDRWTGTWFDDRHLTVKTRPVTEGQLALFLPAPLIELQSLAIDGETVDLDEVAVVDGHLERVDGLPWACSGPLGIVVVGVFGYDPIPGGIIEATAALAASMGGLRVRQAFDAAGTFQAIRDNRMPPWAEKALDGYRRQNFLHQPFDLTPVLDA